MMRFLMRSALAAVLVASGMAGSADAGWPWSSPKRPDVAATGPGARLNNVYDPCWPQRYSAAARQSVLAPFAQQALNGHIINQTLWNYHFESGTDRLTAAGVEKLDSLGRMRPGPDPKIYLQTSRDLASNADTVDGLLAARTDLDTRRANMIVRFLAAQPVRLPYEIYVHDPADTSIFSVAASNAYRSQMQGYVGGIQGAGTVGAVGSGGGAAAGSVGSAGAGAGAGTGTR